MHPQIDSVVNLFARTVKQRWEQLACMSISDHLDKSSAADLCPRCASTSFGRRGAILLCDACGWDSARSCGADGFTIDDLGVAAP